jgi:hypothetical protein
LPRSSTLGEKYTNGRCGVARAVRSEQAEHGAGPDREVDAVQRPGLAELLDQPSAMIEYVMPVGCAAALTGYRYPADTP